MRTAIFSLAALFLVLVIVTCVLAVKLTDKSDRVDELEAENEQLIERGTRAPTTWRSTAKPPPKDWNMGDVTIASSK